MKYDTKGLEEELRKTQNFIRFEEDEKKILVVTGWNEEGFMVRKKFSDSDPERLQLKFKVVSIDGKPCDPPKEWTVTNIGLLKQLKNILDPLVIAGKGSVKLLVKRGNGKAKNTTYICENLE